jgi:hypothetical protein
MDETTSATSARLSITGIAEHLGFGVSAVKKWRGNTRRALIRAGQLDSPNPTCVLPSNALPVPSNQAEHVRDGVAPRWDRELIDRWAERTIRKDPLTGEKTQPTSPGAPVRAAA